MPRRKQAPELTFQQHVADILVRVHGLLDQADIVANLKELGYGDSLI